MTPAIAAAPIFLRNRLGTAAPTAPSGPAPPPPSPPCPHERFNVGKALALPAYTYGAASGVLSGLTGFAERFPAGGVTINPDGIIRNPDWTRHFGEGSTLRGVQPILAGFSAAIHLARGLAEVREASRTGCARAKWAAGLDLAIAGASALQIAAPGLGGAATLAFAAARFGLELHP